MSLGSQSGQRTFTRRRISQPTASRLPAPVFPALVLPVFALLLLPLPAQAALLPPLLAPFAQLPDNPQPVLTPGPKPGWYARFSNGPQRRPLTPRDKGWLAARNVIDPINDIAIVGTSAIVVASNPYSPYGPGMAGFARNVGVAYAQNMTGEFFGTFLIPSIFHQNPHYHRLPHARFYRRLLNTCTQVLWGYGDNGRGMPNYANIIGFAIDDEIGNLYVPGRDTDLPSSAKRYALTFVLVPTDNLVSEFLPDVAHRINTHYVFIQRIINAVAGPDTR